MVRFWFQPGTERAHIRSAAKAQTPGRLVAGRDLLWMALLLLAVGAAQRAGQFLAGDRTDVALRLGGGLMLTLGQHLSVDYADDGQRHSQQGCPQQLPSKHGKLLPI